MKPSINAELEQIYRAHRGGMFSLALSVVGCEQAAEDAIHEAYVALYRRDSLGDDPVAYVFRTVRNACIDQTRQRRRDRKASVTIFNGYSPPASRSNGLPSKLLDLERDQILRQAIDGLPPDQRELVVLKAFAELTFDQIAGIVGEPMKTVATRYRRALGKLERELRGKL